MKIKWPLVLVTSLFFSAVAFANDHCLLIKFNHIKIKEINIPWVSVALSDKAGTCPALTDNSKWTVYSPADRGSFWINYKKTSAKGLCLLASDAAAPMPHYINGITAAHLFAANHKGIELDVNQKGDDLVPAYVIRPYLACH